MVGGLDLLKAISSKVKTEISIVYRNKLAIHYLTEAMEMGYYDSVFELARAHLSLSEWYSKNGGDELAKRLKESRIVGYVDEERISSRRD